MLRLLRKFNKSLRASQWARIKTERFFKSRAVYNYLEVPDVCFKSKSREVVLR